MSLKIMVVDDEPVSAKLIRTLAVPLGHTVLTFEGSEVDGQRAEAQRFDVAFLGTRKSEMDGIELARRVRNSQPNRETTIVILGATDDVAMLRTAFGVGVQFVIPSPVTAARVAPMLKAMGSPGWKTRIHAARLPLFTEVRCQYGGRNIFMRSLNLSESGILLQRSGNVEVGQEVELKFEIEEIKTSLNLRARVVRVEGLERTGMEFIALKPEHRNAIQLYVLGHLRDPARRQELPDARIIDYSTTNSRILSLAKSLGQIRTWTSR